MHKAFIASTFLISCTIITSVSYAKDCDIEHYSFVFGQDTSTHMTVKSGKSCGSTITTRGGGMQSLAVSQPPQSGSAVTPTLVRWEYRSKPGYSGKDAFVVQGSGESMGQRGVHRGNVNINVDVDVVP